MIVGVFTLHTRVVVPEERDAVDAECGGRVVHLGHPPLGDRLARRERVGRVLPQFAARREDEDDAVSLRLGACHGAPGRDRLVVGVRVEGDQRVRHESLPRRKMAVVGASCGYRPVTLASVFDIRGLPGGRMRGRSLVAVVAMILFVAACGNAGSSKSSDDSVPTNSGPTSTVSAEDLKK